jgi:hypothetical protein
MTGPLTERQLNRATLARQLLLRREPMPVTQAVRHAVALQAQEAASPYIALWNRVADFDPAEMDMALADHALVKASLMRVTLHIVHVADYPILHEAMQPTLRAARLHDSRFRRAGLSVEEVEALLPEMLDHAQSPRTNAEMEAWLDERLGRVLEQPSVWWAVRHFGPFVHAPVGGPWSFGPRPAYKAAQVRDRPGDRAASMRKLVCRYLEGFGPATLDDVSQFALLYKAWIRPVVEAMAAEGELATMAGPGKRPLYDVPGAPAVPAEDTPAPPRLLPMWDSVLLAYADRSRIMPPAYRKAAIRSNGDVLPTLLVDGQVAGVWRPTSDGIEATAFHALDDEAWAGLEVEASALLAMLSQREPLAYSRYARWWADLPAAEVRLLR